MSMNINTSHTMSQRACDVSDVVLGTLSAKSVTEGKIFSKLDRFRNVRGPIDLDFINENIVKLLPEFDLRNEYAQFGFEASTVLLVSPTIDVMLRFDCSGEASRWLLNAKVFGKSYDLVIDVLARFESGLPRFEIDESDGNYISFWYYDDRYAADRTVKANCPNWKDIKVNYPSDVADSIQSLIDMKNPFDNGKIVLWYGPPGTGKTYAARALMREWRRTLDCTCEVVLDPDVMFNETAYMCRFITESRPSSSPYGANKSRSDLRDSPIPRLILMEDAGDLFTIDCARRQSGFGRLLNLTDGLMGQGLPIVTVFTSNDDVDKIDEAITRKGRCIQHVGFHDFSNAESVKWFEAKGIDVGDELPTRLSDMFALANGSDNSSLDCKERLGFSHYPMTPNFDVMCR